MRHGTAHAPRDAGTQPYLPEPYNATLAEALAAMGEYYGHQIEKPDDTPFFLPHEFPEGVDEGHFPTEMMHANYLQHSDLRSLGEDIQAHRGLINLAEDILENSFESFDAAADAGIMTHEYDVMTAAPENGEKRGKTVIFHDRTAARMLGDDKNRLISDITPTELKSMPLVNRHPIDGNYYKTKSTVPMVDEIIQKAHSRPGTSIVLDCKDDHAVRVFVDHLLDSPDNRKIIALKPYSKHYVGGFDQFVGEIYKDLDIDPKSAADKPKRDKVLAALKETKLVPILSQVMLTNSDLQKSFPAKPGATGVDALAQTGTAWVDSWNKGTDVKIVEAHPMGDGSETSNAMLKVNDHIEKSDDYKGVVMSGSYRFPDFQIQALDDLFKFFTWGDSGDQFDKTGDPVAAVRSTPGALPLMEKVLSLLSDLPIEEAYFVGKGEKGDRGNPGAILNVEKGTELDLEKNKDLTTRRKGEYDAKVPPFDLRELEAVRRGMMKAKTSEGSNNWMWLLLAVPIGFGIAKRKSIMHGLNYIGSGQLRQDWNDGRLSAQTQRRLGELTSNLRNMVRGQPQGYNRAPLRDEYEFESIVRQQQRQQEDV